jgi:hypothetical protein
MEKAANGLISRRVFLKKAGLSTFSLLLAACAPDLATLSVDQILPADKKIMSEELVKYFPEIGKYTPTSSADIVLADGDPIWVLNYTQNNINVAGLKTYAEFLKTTAATNPVLDYPIGDNMYTISIAPRAGKKVLMYLPESIPAPTWNEQRSQEGGTLVINDTQVQISFVRYVKNDLQNANETTLVEACQAMWNMDTGLGQEVGCNSTKEAWRDRIKGLSYAQYKQIIADVINNYLRGFDGKKYPKLAFTQWIYDTFPKVGFVK